VTAYVAAFALTAGLVAQATGGRLTGGSPDTVFESVSIDTRTLQPGALFIAIKGDNFDGHEFVDEAVRRGAAGMLVSRAPQAVEGGVDEAPALAAAPAVTIVVDDTLEALQALGRDVRRRSGARVVAITGSAGKTTTKEIVANLLQARFRVFRNTGNLNNHIGLPLSLTELRHGPDVAVVEFGMNHAGEIRTLVGIAEPDVRVWTNVGDAHIGFFGSREAVASAKAELLEQATAGTVVVANADDPLVMSHVGAFRGRRVTFGESATADVRATNVVDRGFDGTTADVVTRGGTLRLSVALPGRISMLNALAGVAVALEFAIPPEAIESVVAAVRPVARRGALHTLPGGVRLVDDSYNASPAAVQAMLAALAATETRGRRIAVLGEMRELGEAALELHTVCGRAAAAAGVDVLVAVGGPAADGLVAGARAAGLAADRIHRFAESAAACEPMAVLIQPGDLVLVKGSRGTRMDVVADFLRREGGAG